MSGEMLTGTATSLNLVLTELFNLSIKTEKISKKWKIPKTPNDADNSYNYRPMSLFSMIQDNNIC